MHKAQAFFYHGAPHGNVHLMPAALSLVILLAVLAVITGAVLTFRHRATNVS